VRAAIRGAPAPDPARAFPVAEAALEALKSLAIPMHVLLVTQRDEVGPLGQWHAPQAPVALLKAHGVAYSWCRLSQGDFMPYDGHPNRTGYDKLVSCADKVLDTLP
jgi:hypothetical protein